MQKIDVMVDWAGTNYGGHWTCPDMGIVVSTAKTWEGFKKDSRKISMRHWISI